MEDDARPRPPPERGAESKTALPDEPTAVAWLKRTLLPPSCFQRAVVCRLQGDRPPYVLLVGDHSIDVWARSSDRHDSVVTDEEQRDAPPLYHVDAWDMREDIAAVDVLQLHEDERDTLVTGSSAGALSFWQWSSPSLPPGGGRLSAVRRLQLKDDEFHRPFHVHHLRICHSSQCIIAATLDGRIATVPLIAGASDEEEKAPTVYRTSLSHAVAYQRVDGILLSLDLLPPVIPASSSSVVRPMLRAVLGYCSPPPDRQTVSCSGRMWLASIHWDGVAPLVHYDGQLTCAAGERIQLVRGLSQAIQLGAATISAIVLTNERALLVTSAGSVAVASKPLPVSAPLSCAVWQGSTLLCAFDGGTLFSLHITAEDFRWQRLGTGLPCVNLTILPSMRDDDSAPLLLAVGDACDSVVLKLQPANVNGLSVVQQLDSCAPLWDFDVVQGGHSDLRQMQLITACGLGAQSSLCVLTAGISVEFQSASIADFELLRLLVPLRHRASSPHHLLVLCSFLSSSRVLSCQSDLTDVTDLTLIKAEERTIAAAFICDGSFLVQITAHSIRVVRVNPSGRSAASVFANAAVALEWRVQALGGGEVRVTHAATFDCWLVLEVLPSSRLVLCQLTAAVTGGVSLLVHSQISIGADLSCLSLFRVGEDEPAEGGMLLCAVGTHSSSLAVYRIATGSTASTVALQLAFAHLLSPPGGAGAPPDEQLHIAESCCYLPTGSTPRASSASERERCGLLLVGMRDGGVVQLAVERSAALPLSPSSPIHLTVVALSRLGNLPVQLCAASSGNLPHSILAVSGHLSMLRPSPLSSPALACSPVADVFEYVHAVHFSTPAMPAGSILALRDARLHLLSMTPTPSVSSPSLLSYSAPSFHSARLPLMHTPRHVLYLPLCHCVAVALDSPGSSSLLLVDVRPRRTETGEEVATVVNRYERLTDGERVVAMHPLAFHGSDACCLVVGTAATGPKPRSSRGRLLLFHLTSADSSPATQPPSAAAIGRVDFHPLAAVRTRGSVTDFCVHPTRGVLCAAGSWLTLLCVQGHPESAEGPSWSIMSELEMRNRILSIDVRDSLAFVSIYKDGVSAVSIEGEHRLGTSLTMRVVQMDPTPRTARHVLSLDGFGDAPDASSPSFLSVEPRVLAVDAAGGLAILRAVPDDSVTSSSASTVPTALSPPPPPPSLMELNAQGELPQHVAVTRLRALHQLRTAAATSPLTAFVATVTGGVASLTPLHGSQRDVHLLLSLDRHLRRCVNGRASDIMEQPGRRRGGSVSREGEASQSVIDGDTLLSLLCCSAEERSFALSGWKGPGENEIRRALWRIWTQLQS